MLEWPSWSMAPVLKTGKRDERFVGSNPTSNAIIQSNIWLIILVVEIDGYSILLTTIPRQTLIFDFVLKYIANISMAG